MEHEEPYFGFIVGSAAGEWTTKESSTQVTFSRPLGILERKFDDAASQSHTSDPSEESGQSDIFMRFWVELEGDRSDASFFARLPLAWATLRARHPGLACTVQDEEAPGSEARAVPPSPCRRRLVYAHPSSPGAALDSAMSTIVLDEQVGADRMVAAQAKLLNETILNGPRTLSQASCLARLFVIRDLSESGKARRHIIFLNFAHVICDGLSAIRAAQELFTLLASPELVTPSTHPPYHSLSVAQPSSLPNIVRSHAYPLSTLEAWRIWVPPSQVSTLLTPSAEAAYPPFSTPDASAATSFSSKGTVARERWVWAIAKVLATQANERHPPSLLLPRLNPHSAKAAPPRSEWTTLHLAQEHTTVLQNLAKLSGVTMNHLLYAIISIALANVLDQQSPESSYQPITLSFPISLRRFLHHPSWPSTIDDLAIRITFGQLLLPNSPINTSETGKLRWAAVHHAKLASRQFQRLFDAAPHRRSFFLANSYFMIFDKLRTSLGLARRPISFPRGTMTASMIGNVDKALPRTFQLANKGTLHLSDMLIGTRLHRGEGLFSEIFVWDGRVTFALGFDDRQIDPQLIRAILNEVEKVAVALADHEASSSVA